MEPIHVVKVWYQNDWGMYARRDERLCVALARDPRVARVLHLEPPVSQQALRHPSMESKDVLGWVRRSSSLCEDRGVQLFTPTYDSEVQAGWLQVLEQLDELFQRTELFARPTILWVSAPSELGERISRAFGDRFHSTVTELEDDHRRYCDDDRERHFRTHKRYEYLVRSSDLLIGNNERFLAEFGDLGTPTLHVPNAVDATAYAAPTQAPEWLQHVPGPRAVYVGSLRVRLRADLVEALARSRPDLSVVLCGEGAETLPVTLRSLANVHTPGRVAPESVPALLCSADVLLLPHEVDPLTDTMDPQKVPEYLASGRPIVATPVHGARQRADLLSLAETPAQFCESVTAALSESDPAIAGRRRNAVMGQTWDAAAHAVLEEIQSVEEPGSGWRRERSMRYFEHDRPEIRALVVPSAREWLDVGCGAGALSEALLVERPGGRAVGIEIDETAAERARTRLQEVHLGSLESVLPSLPTARFDAVILADVLEHVLTPERVLREVHRVLRPRGQLVIGLPNVRHWSVLKGLLEGEFEYTDAGILDHTHVRFFTRRSALRLLREQGFDVDRCTGVTWQAESVPPNLLQAMEECGLDIGDLHHEAQQHQWLFTAVRRESAPIECGEDAAPRAGEAGAPGSAAHGSTGAGRVSVVIPVCNAVGYTRQCLDEIERWCSGAIHEIIVVDNGSTDETPEVLAEAGVRVIRNEENRGYAAAVNQGVRAAEGEWILCTNNDVLFMEGFLERLMDAATQPNVAMAGPCTNYANGRQQVDCGPLESVDHLREVAALRAHENDRKREDVSFLSGFCFLARRNELLEADGLAEAYGNGTYEDTELSRRLRRTGRRLVIARDAFVYHFGNRTFQSLGIDLDQQQAVNQAVFLERHASDALPNVRDAMIAGQFERAFRLAREQLGREPHDLDALAAAAEALIRAGRGEQAAILVERYSRRCPDDGVLVPWLRRAMYGSEDRSDQAVHAESRSGSGSPVLAELSGSP